MHFDFTTLFKQVNRLLDIETREVSLVDRGANQRTFLVAKSSGDLVEVSLDGDDYKSTENVLLKLNSSVRDSLSALVLDINKALEEFVKTDSKESLSKAYVDLVNFAETNSVKLSKMDPMSPDSKQITLECINRALETMVMIGEGVRDAEVDEDAPMGLPDPVAEALMMLASDIAMFVMEAPEMSDEPDMPKYEDKYEDKGDDELYKLKQAVQEIKTTSLDKRGRKMNAQRLKQLEGVVEKLVSILMDVGSSLNLSKDTQKSVSPLAQNDDKVKKLEAKVENLSKLNQDLIKRINSLQEMVKSKNALIEKFESIPSPSNGLTNVGAPGFTQETIWPNDLNDEREES